MEDLLKKMQVNFKTVADEGHCKHTFFWCVKRAGTQSPHQCRLCKARTLRGHPARTINMPLSLSSGSKYSNFQKEKSYQLGLSWI